MLFRDAGIDAAVTLLIERADQTSFSISSSFERPIATPEEAPTGIVQRLRSCPFHLQPCQHFRYRQGDFRSPRAAHETLAIPIYGESPLNSKPTSST